MARLFIALRPPASVRQHLRIVMHGIDGARWQDDDQLHITLRFIGEVDRHQAADIADGLARIAAPPLTLAVSGTGCFERRGQAEALWAGISPPEAITALHRKVDRVCVASGLQPEARAYLPHVTLARFSRGHPVPDRWLAVNAALASAAFTVDAFGLYESTLGREGALYHLVERYQLRA